MSFVRLKLHDSDSDGSEILVNTDWIKMIRPHEGGGCMIEVSEKSWTFVAESFEELCEILDVG